MQRVDGPYSDETIIAIRDNPEDQSSCLVEAYRLLRSNAYQLHLVIQENQLVQDLVTFFLSCGVFAQRIQISASTSTKMPIVGPFLMIVMIFHGSCFAAHTGRKFPVPYFSDEAALNREFQADKRDVCEDKIEFCPVYKANGYCDSSHQYYKYVYTNCHASCERCQAPPTPPPAVDKVACLAAHNNKREIHGSPPLAWDDELEKKAQEWANHLLKIDKLVHATEELERLKQGENLYYAKAVRHKTCEDAMKGWYDDEEGLYNYDNPGFSLKTGHFTQVVWKSTTKVGVALAAKRGSDGYMVTYIVARYFPAGNIVGQYGENVQRKS